METKFKVGDNVVDGGGYKYTISKVRFDVDGRPIYHGEYDSGLRYMLFRGIEIRLDNSENNRIVSP